MCRWYEIIWNLCDIFYANKFNFVFLAVSLTVQGDFVPDHVGEIIVHPSNIKWNLTRDSLKLPQALQLHAVESS